MTSAVQSAFLKNLVATVTVLGLYQPCAAFLRGSLNNCSVPDRQTDRHLLVTTMRKKNR